MTRNRNFKRRVRSRASKAGESYTAALRHVRKEAPADSGATPSVRLAVAQTSCFRDPSNAAELRASGEEMRHLMREARLAGARVVHFPEGTTCSPNKRLMSANGPREIGASDWSRFRWDVLESELAGTCRLARELGLWTVFGSVHRLTAPHRPHNSLYIVSDSGRLVTRYDERMLSNTKVSFMYTPGRTPVTFEVDRVRFGCAMGMESHFPEIFAEYERLDADCVLFSTTGESPNGAAAFAAEVLGHAAANTYWVSFALHAPASVSAPCGVASPDGGWAALCRADGVPSLAVVDIRRDADNPARPWRRLARAGIYDAHLPRDDPRSDGRDLF